MKIRALETMDFTAEGHTLSLRQGEAIDVPEAAVATAEIAIAHGFAEQEVGGGSPKPSGPDADPGDEPDEADVDDLSWPDGLSPRAIAALEDEGVLPDHVAGMTDEEILDVDGVGQGSLEILRDAFGASEQDTDASDGEEG